MHWFWVPLSTSSPRHFLDHELCACGSEIKVYVQCLHIHVKLYTFLLKNKNWLKICMGIQHRCVYEAHLIVKGRKEKNWFNIKCIKHKEIKLSKAYRVLNVLSKINPLDNTLATRWKPTNPFATQSHKRLQTS